MTIFWTEETERKLKTMCLHNGSNAVQNTVRNTFFCWVIWCFKTAKFVDMKIISIHCYRHRPIWTSRPSEALCKIILLMHRTDSASVCVIGFAWTTPATAPDGTTPATTPAGTTPATAPDGTTPATAPDGTTPATAPDGTTLVTHLTVVAHANIIISTQSVHSNITRPLYRPKWQYDFTTQQRIQNLEFIMMCLVSKIIINIIIIIFITTKLHITIGKII